MLFILSTDVIQVLLTTTLSVTCCPRLSAWVMVLPLPAHMTTLLRNLVPPAVIPLLAAYASSNGQAAPASSPSLILAPFFQEFRPIASYYWILPSMIHYRELSLAPLTVPRSANSHVYTPSVASFQPLLAPLSSLVPIYPSLHPPWRRFFESFWCRTA